jgi:lipopolysaccharide/colanic/teichoic acid biosynthesis glycosyltransferase
MKNYLEKERYYWWKMLLDGIMLVISFLGAYYLKRGHLVVEPDFQKFFGVLILLWFGATIFSKKFLKIDASDYLHLVKPFITAGLVMAAFISLFVYILGWYHLSRLIIYGTFAIFLALEFCYVTVRTIMWKRRGKIKKIPFSVVFFLLELMMVVVGFVAIYYYHKGTIELSDEYMVLLMGIFFAWFLVSLLMHRYRIPEGRNFLKVIFPFWRSQLLSIGLVAFFIFISNLAMFSRFIILGSLLVFSLLESLVVLLYFIYSRSRGIDVAETGLFTVETIDYRPLEVKKEIFEAPARRYGIPGSKHRSAYLKQMLANIYLHRAGELYRFVEASVNLERIDVTRSAVLYSPQLEQIDMLPEDSLHLLVNFQKINDFRRINRHFIAVNRRLVPGGIFVGRFESIRQRRNRLYRNYPLPLARLLHLGDFLSKRVIPKLPLLKRFYFGMSKGRNRAISFTESMGRLFFCGFKVIAWKEIDNYIYFIVRKVKAPLSDDNPSYGLLFKQRRIGKDGKIIYMYKLRTMHPYAEYIQDYVHRHHQLAGSGKIKNDFRITYWGRFFRKFLIDEIPMLINWLKRDVKLVGVRPLSESFFSTYPAELQKERIKVRPGLVPPYYADMPGSIEEVWASEKQYLGKYKKHPLWTDVVYFFKAWNNILFHHSRSS